MSMCSALASHIKVCQDMVVQGALSAIRVLSPKRGEPCALLQETSIKGLGFQDAPLPPAQVVLWGDERMISFAGALDLCHNFESAAQLYD